MNLVERTYKMKVLVHRIGEDLIIEKRTLWKGVLITIAARRTREIKSTSLTAHSGWQQLEELEEI